MRATTNFEIFTWESPEFISEKNHNKDFGVDMENRTRARLNIYDYAGEDDLIFTALEQISNSEKYIIVFVLSSIAESTPSSKYFNLTAIKKIKQHLANSTSECLSPFIVFNKQDLMSQAPQDPVSFSIDLMSHHQGAIENIQSIFGDTINILVSAETGFGVANFTRRMLSRVVDSNGKPIR